MIVVPSPACAQGDDVLLTLGGQGSTAWSLGSVRPGDHGVQEVEIRNGGPREGYVTIWVSDVQETDLHQDGAALSKYVQLSLDVPGLTTSVEFPATIHELPSHPSVGNKVHIGPIPSGGAITARWEWEFVETGVPQNDAQGDGLSFSINYLLAELPPPGEEYYWIMVDVLGQETAVAVNATGVVQGSVQAYDPTGRHLLALSPGTRIVTIEGEIPSHLRLAELPSGEAALPDGAEQVGPLYRLSAVKDGVTPTQAYFVREAGLVLGVDPSQLPEGPVRTAIFLLEEGRWVEVPGSGGAYSSWEARGFIDRTGTYAVGAVDAENGTAFITAGHLSMERQTRELWWPLTLLISYGSSVQVRMVLTNLGDARGSYTVPFILDGQRVEVRVVELGPGESTELVVTLDGLADGEHELLVGGVRQSFRTETVVNWPMVLAIIFATAVSVWLIGRSRRPKEIPLVVMLDYKSRVIRELGQRGLSFEGLALMTSIPERPLVRVLNELWVEGSIGVKKRGAILYFVKVGPPKKGV